MPSCLAARWRRCGTCHDCSHSGASGVGGVAGRPGGGAAVRATTVRRGGRRALAGGGASAARAVSSRLRASAPGTGGCLPAGRPVGGTGVATRGRGTLAILMLQGDLEQELGRRVAAAVRAAFDLAISPEEAVIRPAAPDRQADYQSNASMALARRLQMPSPQVAARIVERLEVGDMLEVPRAEGPGFVNFRLRRDWLEGHVTRLATDDRLGVPPAAPARRAVIDY